MFAGQDIPRGACIIEYTGRPATPKQIRENTGKYLFWTSAKTMIDGYIPANRARFINHSCAPNCEIDIKNRRIYIFANRAIKAGEELTYDYNMEAPSPLPRDWRRRYACRCGTPRCRGTIVVRPRRRRPRTATKRRTTR